MSLSPVSHVRIGVLSVLLLPASLLAQDRNDDAHPRFLGPLARGGQTMP